MSNQFNKWQPFIYGTLLAMGVMLGIWLRPSNTTSTFYSGKGKINEILSIIRETYVDTVDVSKLEKETIDDMLSQLDPHSVYIPASELKQANEGLDGNFEGIGVEFNILNDTIMVVSALNGGPSQELGIQSGDRIVQVDSLPVAGVGITSEKVYKLLRGKKGTQVDVLIFRPSTKRLQNYHIKRNTIPIYSVDASYMLNKETGYIKVSRFAEKTHEEFLQAFKELKSAGLQNLIIDLRGNPGGYLNTATNIADELIGGHKLIVYTKGLNKPSTEFYADIDGVFETGKLVLLIDEGSASASEILSGAVQDWDRGLIVGRRSFGKGLVQEPFQLSDGSALRLTVSRYYIPSNRCIQKPYETPEAYEHDLLRRYESGELEDALKLKVLDSTPYFTKELHRVVHGGGGISPDLFVPLDTSFSSLFLTEVVSKGMISKFAYDYLDRHRKEIESIKEYNIFVSAYQINEHVYKDFIEFAVAQGATAPNKKDEKKSQQFIQTQIKALIGRQIWREKCYYKVIYEHDKTLQAALNALNRYTELLAKPATAPAFK